MKTEEEVLEKMNEILNDERFWYEPASVQINAPLALIQTEMEARFRAYCWFIGISPKIAKETYLKNKNA